MFNAEEIKKLLAATKKLLTVKDSRTITDAEELRNVLRFHEYRYYVIHHPLITDGEYDLLYKLLESYETLHPTSITKDSPTQRVGSGLIKRFSNGTAPGANVSLENSYNAEDLLDWDRKVREVIGLDEVEYVH